MGRGGWKHLAPVESGAWWRWQVPGGRGCWVRGTLAAVGAACKGPGAAMAGCACVCDAGSASSCVAATVEARRVGRFAGVGAPHARVRVHEC